MLRIRSLNSKATARVAIPTPCSLQTLKSLIADGIGSSPDSLRLSLNRKDEIDALSPDQTLQSLGIISGDLVFYSLRQPQSNDPNPNLLDGALTLASNPSKKEGTGMDSTGMPSSLNLSDGVSLIPASNPSKEEGTGMDSTGMPSSSNLSDEGSLIPACNPPKEEVSGMDSTGLASTSHLSDSDMVDVEDDDGEVVVPYESSRLLIPGFLRRVMMEEVGVGIDNLTLLVTAIHGLFLESGFTATGGTKGCCKLPEGWASKTSPVLLLSYVTPEMNGLCDEATVGVKVLCTGKFATVYGHLTGNSDVYRVCFDVSRFGSSLSSYMHETNGEIESRVFELCKMVKDRLCLPLLMDISDKYNLPLPPCFARLPIDVKIMIMESLPGIDLGRVACVSSEMRYLSSNDELWGKKFVEEFGVTDEKGLFGRRWKDKFVICSEKRKRDWKSREERSRRFDGRFGGMPRPYWRRPAPFGRPMFNVIGGDYDRLPAIGNSGGSRNIGFFRDLNFPNRCNVGGFHG